MFYAIYGTRGVVEWLIQHEAKPSALSDTRPQPECHKSRKARLTYIKWFKVYATGDSVKLTARGHLRVLPAHTKRGVAMVT